MSKIEYQSYVMGLSLCQELVIYAINKWNRYPEYNNRSSSGCNSF